MTTLSCSYTVTTVTRHLTRFIPAPILVLPGAEALLRELLNDMLREVTPTSAAREIPLGIGSVSLGLAPFVLQVEDYPARLIGFKPPTELGFALGTDVVSGGGSLGYERIPGAHLRGSMGLKMGMLQVFALAILQEEVGNYALTTLLSARFAPGIQLGFGFAISGIGGLVGINRAVDAGALEARFRSGELAAALFGDNPTANASATLDTLHAVFRLQMGSHIFGPTMQLSWLKVGTFTLFNIDLGVFMQLPGPGRIDIIGSARAGIPLVFQLRLDIRGELDFARRTVGIQAVIVDSHVMGIFRLQGEAIFRLRYGDDPYVVLTVGGFFPGFNPAPAEVPADIRRVGLSLDVPRALPLYLRAEGYLAVTANTLQFGADMEARFNAGFSASGHFKLDAIFQFDPFQFETRFSGGFHIGFWGKNFTGVTCSGTITGPGPLVILARITLETPFFMPDITWSDTFTIGDPAPVITASIHLMEAMQSQLNTANLHAENSIDPHVVLRVKQTHTEQFALLSPLGDLVWSQRLLPLGMTLHRLNNVPLFKPGGVTVTVAGQSPDVPHEQFNLSMYRDLTDAQRMNLNAQVELYPAGVRYHHPLQMGEDEMIEIKFQEFRHPDWEKKPDAIARLLSFALLSKVTVRGAAAVVSNLEPRVTTTPEIWQVDNKTFATHGAAYVAAQEAGTLAHLALDVVDMEGV